MHVKLWEWVPVQNIDTAFCQIRDQLIFFMEPLIGHSVQRVFISLSLCDPHPLPQYSQFLYFSKGRLTRPNCGHRNNLSYNEQWCIQSFLGEIIFSMGFRGCCDAPNDLEQSLSGGQGKSPINSKDLVLLNDLLWLETYPLQHILNVSIGDFPWVSIQFFIIWDKNLGSQTVEQSQTTLDTLQIKCIFDWRT